MTREVWSPIPGTNGKYEISNLGNVKSFVRKIAAVKAIFAPTENGKKVLTDVFDTFAQSKFMRNSVCFTLSSFKA